MPWFECLLFVFATALLSGCAATTPDLKRLYEVSSADYVQNPVILIPGAFGSKLRRISDAKSVWPPSAIRALLRKEEKIALDIYPATLEPLGGDTEAYALFDKVGGRDFYGRILRVLREAGGYTPGSPGHDDPGGPARYYVFAYDWRQDLVSTTAALDRLIEQIRKDHQRPDLKVDIIAHSMGALFVRYYALYGTEDVLAHASYQPTYTGAAKLRKVVLLGAPNLGSVSALQFFMMGYRFGLGEINPEVLATMPSAYQILPHPDRDWMIQPDGKKFARDLYAVSTWRDNQWSIFDPDIRARIASRFTDPTAMREYLDTFEKYFAKQLRRARDFHRALSVPANASPVRFVLFGGDCELTPARCLVEEVNGKTLIRLNPDDVVNRVPGVNYAKLLLEPGDGRVTKPSLLARNALDPSIPVDTQASLPVAYSIFLCERHSQLTGNISFQDNLLNMLLQQETTLDRLQRSTP